MKTFLAVLCIFTMATVAFAGKPDAIVNGSPVLVECGFNSVAWEWDFSQGDHGFTTAMCDDQGGPTWAHGEENVILNPPMTVWGTVLNAYYASDTGEALISPYWTVTEMTYMVELVHWYSIEEGWDGGNLMVNGEIVPPVAGYDDDMINDSASFYAWCVNDQPGFTGVIPANLFITSCFDLSSFMGQEVQLEFQFGSDSSVVRPGWYFSSISVGTDVIATEDVNWGNVKGMYR